MTARVVRWSDAAQRDLDDIVDCIAAQSVLNAERVLARLYKQAQRLEHFVERGRRLPELGSRRRALRAHWRELLVRPWRIVYAIENGSVKVLAVVDGRRDFQGWLSRRSVSDLSDAT